ncbi:hypothetical protein SEVIR_7G267716v4 [Setaria viridis]
MPCGVDRRTKHIYFEIKQEVLARIASEPDDPTAPSEKVSEMPLPTAGSLSALLWRCAALGALSPGTHLHARALVGGCLPDATLNTDFILLYCRCGALHRARQVFDGMPSPSMHTYNILLAVSPPGTVLELLARLLAAGHRPNRFAVPAAHARSSGTRFLDMFPNVVVSGALLDMYAKAGLLDDAMRVFDEMPRRDAVVWNCMVTGYARAGRAAKALDLFRRGQVEAVNMANDLRAMPSVLNVCAKEGELMKGREIHGRMVRFLAFDSDIAVGNALVDMYAKCGRVDIAWAVFVGQCC